MTILYFFAILSGAGLAYAWLLVAPPVLARLAPRRPAGAAHPLRTKIRAVLRSRPAIAILLLIPFVGVAATLYLRGGIPQDAGDHNGVLERARSEAPHDLTTAVVQLAARLAKDPGDADGWRLLSRSYSLLGEPDKAADAARHAAALAPKTGGDEAAQSATAEDLVTANGGKVVPEARRLFEAALGADPGDPRARFYLGLAAAQDGQGEDALARWLALEADSPADAPWLAGLHANIERLATAMGVGADTLAQRRAALAKATPPAATGPTPADVAAAAQMAPADRSSMVAGMVQRLADRLEHEPGDVDGWLRLGRAYGVLGEQEKALDAYRRATAADPKREDARAAYASAQAAMAAAK
jgi:cytochrome c-type biogenesis protein CcmH